MSDDRSSHVAETASCGYSSSSSSNSMTEDVEDVSRRKRWPRDARAAEDCDVIDEDGGNGSDMNAGRENFVQPLTFKFDESHIGGRGRDNGEENCHWSDHDEEQHDLEDYDDDDGLYFRLPVTDDAAETKSNRSVALDVTSSQTQPTSPRRNDATPRNPRSHAPEAPPPPPPPHTLANSRPDVDDRPSPAEDSPSQPPQPTQQAHRRRPSRPRRTNDPLPSHPPPRRRHPTLDPYIARLENFELFSTHQCYYLVGSDKHGTSYRIMKMDRTLIESTDGGDADPSSALESGASFDGVSPEGVDAIAGDDTEENAGGGASSPGGDSGGERRPPPASPSRPTAARSDAGRRRRLERRSNLRRLSEFVAEDPAAYTQAEIKELLDMINDGNRGDDFMFYGSHGGGAGGSREHDLQGMGSHAHGPGGGGSGDAYHHRGDNVGGGYHRTLGAGGEGGSFGNGAVGGGGLKPVCKAYGVLGFIRFLDCYYLTLITKRAKVGSIGGNSIYTIKVSRWLPCRFL